MTSNERVSVKRNRVFLMIGVAVVIGVGVAWWGGTRSHATANAPTTGVEPAGQQEDWLRQRTKGQPSAAITILEASDFQCPWCRHFWEETLPGIEREYIATGKARFIFLNFPIPSSHPNAPAAHEFAMCAAVQDRFWPMHDLLYQHQQRWAGMSDPVPYLYELADSADLARDSLDACFASGEVRTLIQAEAQMAYRAGITSTPSFVVEGALLGGSASIDVWRPILDSIYTEKTGGQ